MSRFIYNLCESFVVQDLYNIFIVEQAGAFVAAGRSDASTINLMILDITTILKFVLDIVIQLYNSYNPKEQNIYFDSIFSIIKNDNQNILNQNIKYRETLFVENTLVS